MRLLCFFSPLFSSPLHCSCGAIDLNVTTIWSHSYRVWKSATHEKKRSVYFFFCSCCDFVDVCCFYLQTEANNKLQKKEEIMNDLQNETSFVVVVVAFHRLLCVWTCFPRLENNVKNWIHYILNWINLDGGHEKKGRSTHYIHALIRGQLIEWVWPKWLQERKCRFAN